jgi:hypothetical protein
MEQDGAPARGRRTLLPLPGGAGAPPGDTRIPREELADGGPRGLSEAFRQGRPKGASVEKAGGRVKRSVRKRGPAPNRRRVWRAERRHVPETARDKVQRPRRLARHPLDLSRGAEMEDGVPGAAKNTAGGALANASSFRGASHKRVYTRLRRAMASEPGIQRRRHCANFWIPGPAQMRRPGMTGDQLLKCLLSFKLCAW